MDCGILLTNTWIVYFVRTWSEKVWDQLAQPFLVCVSYHVIRDDCLGNHVFCFGRERIYGLVCPRNLHDVWYEIYKIQKGGSVTLLSAVTIFVVLAVIGIIGSLPIILTPVESSVDWLKYWKVELWDIGVAILSVQIAIIYYLDFGFMFWILLFFAFCMLSLAFMAIFKSRKSWELEVMRAVMLVRM